MDDAPLGDGAYDQVLGFHPNGRVATRSLEDRGLRQMSHFFNYQAWNERMNCKEDEAGRRPTGDGGLKRRRR